MVLGAHRKVVTVLFCDVVGSTALGESVDPETLQALLARYFERLKGIIESHGGAVDKFIGDAVMAVFGVPVAHEDDALRACRAAVEIRDALPALGVEGRIGVNSGEVLTGTDERLVTGDAVNVAARFEQAAEPGDVLVGEPTLALVQGAVVVEPVAPLALKGKAEPVSAFRLLSVLAAPERSHAGRFVGRARELAALVDAWGRASTQAGCELVTLVGEAGVGKSRLVAEALDVMGARVVRGRCLPYGKGITYWPVVEVLKQLRAVPSNEVAAAALRALLGESDRPTSADEIAWAFRKLLEEQAPLVVCFDDIQWGEETFLDLVESAGLLATGAPLLLVCSGRPELLERRPSWPVPLRLEPLQPDEAEALIGDSLAEDLRARVAERAGGNPLFIVEMLALATEGGEPEVPATLRALLAARLDQLEPQERSVLERGAVEGEIFHRGAVQALGPEEPQVLPRLAALVRHELIRPERPQLAGEDAFRFHHLLIRDAAYDALPKATRADLHRRFAEWLEEHGRSLVELDEILGYHLEQAADYLAQLSQPDKELALDAGGRLGVAGRRAYWRGDWRTAVGLFERALSLTRPYRFDLRLEVELADALLWIEPVRAIIVADAAAERAEAAGDEPGAALARMVAAYLRLGTGESSADEVERLARTALPLLEAADDDDGLVHVWYALAWVANTRTRFEDWTQAMETALRHARRAGRPVAGLLMAVMAVALVLGPRPTTEVMATFETMFADQSFPGILMLRGLLLAMLDRIDEAWAVALPAAERFREFGFGGGGEWLADIALLAGDYEAAATHLRQACEEYEASGNTGLLSTFAPQLGRVLCALGRPDEAEPLAQRGRDLGDPDDVATQQAWRQAQALIHSERGQHTKAERLAHEAVAFSLRSDSPRSHGDALSDLAAVLEAAGRTEQALATLEQALDCYQRKQIIPLARRTRERLQALQPTHD